MSRLAVSTVVASLLVFTVIWGCGDDDVTEQDTSVTDASDTTGHDPIDEQPEELPDDPPPEETGDEEVVEEIVDPWEAVPPATWEATVADYCNGSYLTDPPVNGQNEDFVVTGDYSQTSSFEGYDSSQPRTFYFMLPDPEEFSGPRPVFFTWHGTGYTGIEAALGIGSWSAGDVAGIESSSALDTFQTVRVNGLDSDGNPIHEDITLDGTTRVDGSTAFSAITSIEALGCTFGTLKIFDQLGHKMADISPIWASPMASGTLTVMSSNESDNQAIVVHGWDDQGEQIEDSLTLDGRNEVEGTLEFAGIFEVVIHADSAGRIHLMDSVGTNIFIATASGQTLAATSLLETDYRTGLQLTEFVEQGFIVIAPDSVANGTIYKVWDAMRLPNEEAFDNADMDLFDNLLGCVAAHYEVDINRIYTGGHSAGGIMTNRVLRTRSEVLAGGIVGSGILDLSAPDDQGALDELVALVTWGGRNDIWSGTTPEGTVVPATNFAIQAASASAFYFNQPNVHQVYCHADDWGHTWLDGFNWWMIDFLLAHPKGLPQHNGWTLVPPEATSEIVCAEAVAVHIDLIEVTCNYSTPPECQDYCQLVGDCAVENTFVRTNLVAQLAALGFAPVPPCDDGVCDPPELSDCSGCVDLCENDAAGGENDDLTALACFSTQFEAAQCDGNDIGAAMPFINAVNTCCNEMTDSLVCTRVCNAINQNATAAGFFATCAQFTN